MPVTLAGRTPRAWETAVGEGPPGWPPRRGAGLAPAGEVPYQFSARGHELAQVLLAQHLTHPHDAATVYYRSRPFLLACGLTPTEALAAGNGRTGRPSEGRGG